MGNKILVVAENYVDFPPHKLFKLPGRFLVQRDNGTFAAVEDQAGVVNKNYGISPVSSDFNLDGYPDLLFSNLDGTVKAFINKGGKSNYIACRFQEKSKYVGTQVQVILNDGSELFDTYVIGEGLSSDQSPMLTFGLDGETEIKAMNIKYPNGEVEIMDNPSINTIHFIGK